jgi:hypothetical protein
MAHINGEKLANRMAGYVLGWNEVEAFFGAPALMLVNDSSDLGRVRR